MAIVRVSQEKFAHHVGCTRENVRRLLAARIIELLPDGKLDLDASRLRYIAHLRDRPRSEANDELRRARAAEVEQRTAQRAHKLIETEESLAVIDDLTGLYLTELGGLAARATRDLKVRKEIENAIFDLRNALAHRISQHADSLRSSGKAATTPATHTLGGQARDRRDHLDAD